MSDNTEWALVTDLRLIAPGTFEDDNGTHNDELLLMAGNCAIEGTAEQIIFQLRWLVEEFELGRAADGGADPEEGRRCRWCQIDLQMWDWGWMDADWDEEGADDEPAQECGARPGGGRHEPYTWPGEKAARVDDTGERNCAECGESFNLEEHGWVDSDAEGWRPAHDDGWEYDEPAYCLKHAG